MAFSSDALLERLKLKRQLRFWRVVCVLGITILLLLLIERSSEFSNVGSSYVARINIEGIITDNPNLIQAIERVENDDNAKALLVYLDTPGGTPAGGEAIHNALRHVAKKKPVVALMGSTCASAGYMIAVSAERIYAYNGTLTGSIGVVLQSVELTKLAENLGVTPVLIKSSELKATPNPLEKLTENQENAARVILMDFYDIFVDMVAQGRSMPKENVLPLADGRVFTGRQAVENGLVDAIGGQREALQWLHKSHKLTELDVREIKIHSELDGFLNRGTKMLESIESSASMFTHKGMMLLWQP